jgi:outer membrane lipoprotein
MRHLGRATLAVIPFLLLVGGCNRQEMKIPERLEGQVDRHLRYVQVKENPDTYRGKLMLAGGEVLSAKRVEEGTRIEVLQIPLSSDLVPDGDRSISKGRFVAMDARKNVTDPAVLGDNKYITIVGEVVGSSTIKIDEVEMQVPQLEVKYITVWDRDRLRPYAGFGYPYAYGRGYRGYYGYPYYW